MRYGRGEADLGVSPTGTAVQKHRGTYRYLSQMNCPVLYQVPRYRTLSLVRRVTWGFLSFWGGSYRIRILMYRDVSCMYLDCILMWVLDEVRVWLARGIQQRL